MATKRLWLLVPLLLALLMAAGATSAFAQPPGPTNAKADLAKLQDFWKGSAAGVLSSVLAPQSGSSANLPGGLTKQLLGKAQPDECFYGAGDPRNGPMKAGGCPTGSQPKVNQAYVWGLAKSGDNVWFGTAPNVHCLVIGGYLGMTDPIQTDSYVCEFGDSKYAKSYGLPAMLGDWRPPQIFVYNAKTKGAPVDVSPYGDPKFQYTLGIRSAGALGDVVFLAGPAMSTGGGINLFAFNSETKAYLGSRTFPQFSNIRKWLVSDGVLYAGVAASRGGFILRWTGSAADPFKFEVVGVVGSDAAELVTHEGRIFVSTWPGTELAGGHALAGLYMSPTIPAGGFHGPTYDPGAASLPTLDPSASWTKVWEVSQYDPDPVTAATYGGGALASYGGYLYWGTMHVPMLSALAHFEVYGSPKSQNDVTAAILGTYRAISIFRGRDFASAKPKMELLYGESALPTYVKTGSSGMWTIMPTKMGQPKWGSSGLGNIFNNYTWSMAVYNGKLYLGTMDWSYLASGLMDSFSKSKTGFSLTGTILSATSGYGADLFVFPSASRPANLVSNNGVGNYLNYGVRNMLSSDGVLYLGMADPMNLMTNPNDNKPEGGWELIQLKDR